MNYLLPILNHFFKELNLHAARVHTFNSFIKNFKTYLQGNEPSNRLLLSGKDVFRDLSNFSVYNLINTGYSYRLDVKDLEIEIDKVLSWEYYSSLIQIYELFNSYIYNLTTEYILSNPQKIEKVRLNLNENEFSADIIRDKIKEKYKTKDILKVPLRLSQYYKSNITANIHGLNISKWFALLTEVRHAVVHKQYQISKKLFEMSSDKQNRRIFDEYFDKKSNGNIQLLYLNLEKFELNKTMLCEIAHFIFKSLSIDSGLDSIYTKLN